MLKRNLFWTTINGYDAVDYGRNLIILIPKNNTLVYEYDVIVKLVPKPSFELKKSKKNPMLSNIDYSSPELLFQDVSQLNETVNYRRIKKYLKQYNIHIKVV